MSSTGIPHVTWAQWPRPLALNEYTEQVLGSETVGELGFGFQVRLGCGLRRPRRTGRREAEHQGQSWVISVRGRR